MPPIAILPLGTGNDLSLCLGWGLSFDCQGVSKLLKQVSKKSIKVKLDIWY